MESLERRRPVVATIICIVTALLVAHSFYRLLPGHQAALRPEMIEAESHAAWFRHMMTLVDVVLEVGGIIALWFMRPVATIFYALQIVTTVINLIVAIVFQHILQVEQTMYANPSRPFGHSTMPGWAAYVLPIMGVILMVGIQISLFLYVWRITALLPQQLSRNSEMVMGQ
jgi:hypothetical protein